MLLYYLLAMNAFMFLLYWFDKFLARHRKLRKYRIPNLILLILPFFGGGIGAFIAMRSLNHKMRRREFRVIIPASIVFDVLLYFVAIYL